MTNMAAITPHLIKNISALCRKFQQSKRKTATEFIEDTVKSSHISQNTINLFFKICKHEKMLEMVVEDYWQACKLKRFNKLLLEILITLLIFKLNRNTYEDFQKTFAELEYRNSAELLEYFVAEENLISFTLIGASFFSDEYVVENLLSPLTNNKDFLIKLANNTRDIKDPPIVKKTSTKPSGPTFLNKIKPTPQAPHPSTVNLIPKFKKPAQDDALFTPNHVIEKRLQICRKKNRKQAEKLLEEARKKQFNCAIVKPKPPPQEEKEKLPKIKPVVPPKTKPVEIKETATTVMRKAAKLAKEQEDEIKRLEKLCSGEFDDSVFDKMAKEEQEERRKIEIENVERKHLEGLLTYEEAIEAKKKLLEVNKNKMEQYKTERFEILAEIDKWKEEEEIKIRAQFEKIQNIEKNARKAERKLKKQKRCNAKLVEDESKKLLKEAYEKKQEELEKKVLLIQELRALNQIRSTYVKKFDPTESPNFGFLCEMSIAELQERLAMVKISMQEELNEKRKEIANSRTRRTEQLENAKRFIEECKSLSSEKPKTKEPISVKDNPKIIELRTKLEEAKKRRLQTV